MCLFPFIYQNKTSTKPETYYECTTDDNDGTPWCPTYLEDGKVGRWKGKGYWGRCRFGCPGATYMYTYILYPTFTGINKEPTTHVIHRKDIIN
jgi:hypothetical protein